MLIPQKDSLWAVITEATELYDKLVQPWSNSYHDLTITGATKYTLHTWSKGRTEPSMLLSEPKKWADLDYMRIESPNVKGETSLQITKPGTGHGFLVWFDTHLAEGIEFSNTPLQPELIYSSAFFPWLEPVKLNTGDTVSITLKANLIDNDYLWRWHTRICSGDHKKTKAEFKQSTFQSIPVTLEEFGKKEAGYIPSLGSRGKIDQAILNLMNGKITNQEITNRIYKQYPEEFANRKEVFNKVCNLSRKYG